VIDIRCLYEAQVVICVKLHCCFHILFEYC